MAYALWKRGVLEMCWFPNRTISGRTRRRSDSSLNSSNRPTDTPARSHAPFRCSTEALNTSRDRSTSRTNARTLARRGDNENSAFRNTTMSVPSTTNNADPTRTACRSDPITPPNLQTGCIAHCGPTPTEPPTREQT